MKHFLFAFRHFVPFPRYEEMADGQPFAVDWDVVEDVEGGGGMLQRLGEMLMQDYVIVARESVFRVVECEAYLTSTSPSFPHIDSFAHGHPIQARPGEFYFHRAGNGINAKYKGGSFKGLDVTAGSGAVYCGILIRGLSRLDPQSGADVADGLISGPCNVVHAILDATGCDSIDELVEGGMGGSLGVFDSLPVFGLRARDTPMVGEKVMATPRIGLTLAKAGNDPSLADFVARKYRYVVARGVGKKKAYTIAGLLGDGLSVEAIAGLSNLSFSSKMLERTAAAWGEGFAAADIVQFFGRSKLNAADLAHMLGAGHAHMA